MERSKFLAWNGWDWIKGLLVSILTAVLLLIQGVLADPTMVNWKQVLIRCGWAAAAALVAYLLKNLVTNKEGEILKSDP